MIWNNILFLSGHGTSFNIDCNVCSCFAGNLVCSTRLCLSEHSSEDDRRTFTGNRGHPEAILIPCTQVPFTVASLVLPSLQMYTVN